MYLWGSCKFQQNYQENIFLCFRVEILFHIVTQKREWTQYENKPWQYWYLPKFSKMHTLTHNKSFRQQDLIMNLLHPLSLGRAHVFLAYKPFIAAKKTMRKIKKKERQKVPCLEKTIFYQFCFALFCTNMNYKYFMVTS